MAEVKVESVKLSGTDKKGNAVFRAEGTVGDRAFEAMTIQWKGEPIFKVLEGGFNLILKESSFSRGERIQIARACKAARIEKFGDSHKEKIEQELAEGETVQISASGPAPKKATSNAAERRMRRAQAGPSVPRHHSGLPMNASISALKRSR